MREAIGVSVQEFKPLRDIVQLEPDNETAIVQFRVLDDRFVPKNLSLFLIIELGGPARPGVRGNEVYLHMTAHMGYRLRGNQD